MRQHSTTVSYENNPVLTLNNFSHYAYSRIKSWVRSWVDDYHNFQSAERTFEGLNLDYAICSTNGIRDNDVTTSSEDEGKIQNVAIKHAIKSLIVADHTKLGHSDMITFRHLDAFDGLITDNQIDKNIKQHYEKFTKVW